MLTRTVAVVWLSIAAVNCGAAPAASVAPAAAGAAPDTMTASTPDPAPPAAAARFHIEQFSPQGSVKGVRQVTARFTSAVVALGDPRLPDPFQVTCAAPGKGRWADGRNWVYDFDADLPGGERCRFIAKRSLRALDGAVLTGTRAFTFTTGGPAVLASLPREGWQAIDADQIFVLKLDALATLDSIREHVHCAIDGIAEAVPVEVLMGAQRDAVLKQRAALGYDYLQLLWKSGAVSSARVRNRNFEGDESSLTVLRCGRQLPPATQIRLIWGSGVAAPSGVATLQDQVLAFVTRPAFTAEVECSRTNARSGCIPMQPINVVFSAPVPASLAQAIRLRSSNGTLYSPVLPPSQTPTMETVSFAGPFPDSARLTVLLPDGVLDDAGRGLENAARFPLSVNVAPYPSLAKFSGTFGILEASEGGVLPVTLRNVEPQLAARHVELPAKMLKIAGNPAVIGDWLRRVEAAAMPSGEWQDDVPTPNATPHAAPNATPDAALNATPNATLNSMPHATRVWRETTGTRSVFDARDSTRVFRVEQRAGSKATEVVGIPLKEPGFYVIELESRLLGASLLGRDEARFVSTAALVTNLAVHFKWGRESSRVWVTRLDTGMPVSDAAVAISDYCSGASLWDGKTARDGIASVTQSLGEPQGSATCEGYAPHPLMVTVNTDRDFSFTLSAWGQGIDPYQFGVPVGNVYSADIYHTVFDRSLFRAGETVSMTHFLRHHEMKGLAVPAGMPATRSVSIIHQGSGQHYELQAMFGADGVAETQWHIPEEAKLGDYAVSIEDANHTSRQSGSFKVEQFRLPSMQATASLPSVPAVSPTQVTLDVHVAYLSGGGASGLPIKLRTLVEAQAAHFPGYDDYQFGGAAVTEGVVSDGNSADPDAESSPDTEAGKAQVVPLALDDQGSLRVMIPKLPPIAMPSRLTAEVEYADANGELLTTTAHMRLEPSALSLGIRREGWVASTDQMRFRVVVLGLDGKPRANQAVTASFFSSTAYSYRKRLIGGFYAYETTRDTRKLTMTCAGLSDAQGLLMCAVAPGISGEILVRAEARDSDGHRAGATASIWVAGKDDWWFGGTSGDRMDVIPEKKHYEAGDTARFQVRMPFRSAAALVTVEREGVLSSFVTHLDGHAPVIEVPITGAYAPNVFVSVLALRGRVAHPENQSSAAAADITALVDLNKPSYREGLAEIKVGWTPHRLDVDVSSTQKTYPVRAQAPVHIHVTRADGGALPAGAEVTIAAVDEALLELAPNASWALLEAMMGERGLEVWTSTAQMQVVGKRHYGRKAVPHGGGGGRELDRAREQFDSLLLWKGRSVLDAHGDAMVTVPLNDSLSSFRIVAVAHAGAQWYGTGSARIATTQDLILLSGLPPLVREGDRFAATFTVRNTTAHAITVDVHAQWATAAPAPDPQRIDIPAGMSRDVTWPVTVPVGSPRLEWRIDARDAKGTAGDRLKISQEVIPAFPTRTYQATIAQLAQPLSLPVQRPVGAIAGRGGLEITVRAKLGDGLDGVHEYMRSYPYVCLEQQLSRSVALRDRAAWDAMAQRLPAYMDADGLLKYFPSDRLEGDDSLSAYVLAIADEAGWALLDGDRQRVIEALRRFVTGRLVRRSALPTADLTIRKLAALDALSRYGAVDPSMLDSVTVEPNLWPTSAVLDWLGILQRLPGVPKAEERRREALQMLRGRLNFQGTVMGFSTERSDALWWLMISADSNANRLVLATLAVPEWRDDIPRLVRGALSRQQDGHWNTTPANAWGVLAMEKFSAAFESTPVTGATGVHYAATQRVISWPQAHGSADLSLPWADGRHTLGVAQSGGGKPWVMVRATAALPLDHALFTGYKITRTVTPIEPHVGHFRRGDVVRVRLDLDAQSDMSWVVVDDPVPAGATVLGSGLGGQSDLSQRGETRGGWAWPAFEERRFDAYRAYYRFVPKGHWSTEYTLRLNNPGSFLLPATRVEAMYAPEMFGELPNAPVTVEEPGHP